LGRNRRNKQDSIARACVGPNGEFNLQAFNIAWAKANGPTKDPGRVHRLLTMAQRDKRKAERLAKQIAQRAKYQGGDGVSGLGSSTAR
jgi:hypothetical protein